MELQIYLSYDQCIFWLFLNMPSILHIKATASIFSHMCKVLKERPLMVCQKMTLLESIPIKVILYGYTVTSQIHSFNQNVLSTGRNRLY